MTGIIILGIILIVFGGYLIYLVERRGEDGNAALAGAIAIGAGAIMLICASIASL